MVAKKVIARPTHPTTTGAYVKGAQRTEVGGRGDTPLYRGGNIPPSPPHATASDEGGDIDLDTFLANLRPDQRKGLLAKLALSSQQESASPQDRDLDLWAQAVYEELGAVLGDEGGGSVGPAVVRRSVAGSSGWRAVREFLKRNKLDGLQVAERLATYRMLAKLIVANARTTASYARIPLTAKLVTSCSVNIAGIFDQSFPGYMSRGLALMVARRMMDPSITNLSLSKA